MSPWCGVGQLRDVRFKPGEHFFTMKPLAASDSNGVPSQQDKPPVSSQSTRIAISPSIFFPLIAPRLWGARYDYDSVMDTHRISVEHLPMNNTLYTAETELLLPMCVSVLNETAAMCSSVARTGGFTGT